MKKLLFIAVCVAALVSCNKQVEQKPFDVMEYDSVTVKDGTGSPVRLSIKYLMDSTANELIKSEEELNQFFEGIVWNLERECKHPRTFIPAKVWNVECTDIIEYNGEKIYVLKSLVDGYAKNGFGVEDKISDVLNLIAWREVTHLEGDEETPATDWAYWHIMPNDKYFVDFFKENIDKKIARTNKANQNEE